MWMFIPNCPTQLFQSDLVIPQISNWGHLYPEMITCGSNFEEPRDNTVCFQLLVLRLSASVGWLNKSSKHIIPNGVFVMTLSNVNPSTWHEPWNPGPLIPILLFHGLWKHPYNIGSISSPMYPKQPVTRQWIDTWPFHCQQAYHLLYEYGCFLKWWYPQNTSKWSFLVGKPMVVGYHHFRKPPSTAKNQSEPVTCSVGSKSVGPSSLAAKTHGWPNAGVQWVNASPGGMRDFTTTTTTTTNLFWLFWRDFQIPAQILLKLEFFSCDGMPNQFETNNICSFTFYNYSLELPSTQ